jgi:hypothetical protein
MLAGPPAPRELPAARPPAAFGSPFLACASDAIPSRTYAVAESTGINDNKGEQPLRPPLPDCACETKLPGNQDSCALKADQTPIDPASLASSR